MEICFWRLSKSSFLFGKCFPRMVENFFPISKISKIFLQSWAKAWDMMQLEPEHLKIFVKIRIHIEKSFQAFNLKLKLSIWATTNYFKDIKDF
jgi:hypothetical protein